MDQKKPIGSDWKGAVLGFQKSSNLTSLFILTWVLVWLNMADQVWYEGLRARQ